jgi:hypothetical protein
MRFEVFEVVKFRWIMTPCNLITGYQRFGRTYCFHLQGREFSIMMALFYFLVEWKSGLLSISSLLFCSTSQHHQI